VRGEPRLHLLQEDVGVVEAAIDQVHGLAVERVEPRRQLLARHHGRKAHRVQHGNAIAHDRHSFTNGEA
jgi:hypothetical protein